MLKTILRLVLLPTIFILLSASMGLAQEGTEEGTNEPEVRVPEAIELPSINSETNLLNKKLTKYQTYLNELKTLSEITVSIGKIEASVEDLEDISDKRLAESSSIRDVREIASSWENIHKKLHKVEERISSLFSDIESEREDLDAEALKWTVTLEGVEKTEENKVLRESIEGNLKNIEIALNQLSDTTNAALAINDRMIRLSERIVGAKTAISDLESTQLSGIFARDQPALWSDQDNPDDTLNFVQEMAHTAQFIKKDVKSFAKENDDVVIIHLLLYILILALLFFISRNYKNWSVFQQETLSATASFLDRPFIAGTFITIFLSFWIYHNIPITIAEILLLINVFPVLFLLRDFFEKKLYPIVYLLCIIFMIDQMSSVLGAFTYTKRWLMLIENLLTVGGFIYFQLKLKTISTQSFKRSPLLSLLQPLIPLTILLLIVAFFANIRGNTAFSYYAVRGITFSSIALLLFYIIVLMSEGVLTLLFMGKYMQNSRIIARYNKKLLKTSIRLLRALVSFLWIRVVLSQFGALPLVVSNLEAIADYSFSFGLVSISLGNIFDSAIVLVVAWYLGAAIRELLETEILPRFNFKRGLPAAVGISTRYFIITFGFFLALASMGIDLEKLGFIAGALSVGIGFGLQNIVGNFISGLILLFERPVVPGDIIQLDMLEGTVIEIGLRSSKVETWDGAEVIIPNMDLISKQVTNLTLTDSKRRKEKIIETEMDADPQVIIEALEKAVKGNKEVLIDPNPMVLFKGQYSNFYRFRVLYWITGNVLVVGSDVSLRVQKALEEIGVRIAIPESKMTLTGGEKEISPGSRSEDAS